MEDFLRDLRQSLRGLLHSPAFTLAALAAIALGIGANTAVFSIVNTVLLKPLNAPDPDRIVQFALSDGSGAAGGSAREFYFRRQQTSIVQDVSALRLELLNLTGSGEPRELAAGRVSAEFFHLFGASFAQGRAFNSDEDRPGGPRVALLSDALWTGTFGGDPGIVGRTLSLSGESYVVIGVVERGFNSQQFDQRPDIWIPYQMDPSSTDGACYCRVVGRLKRGVTFNIANAQLKVATENFRRAYPRPGDRGRTFIVEPLRDSMVGNVRPLLMILAGAVIFVLLIACTNVASLLLVRATSRQREIAVRAALGAGRGRLIRQLLTESLILSLLGGAFGLLIGLAGIRAILRAYPSNPLHSPLNMVNIPRIGESGSGVTLDWRVLAFTVRCFSGHRPVIRTDPRAPGLPHRSQQDTK